MPQYTPTISLSARGAELLKASCERYTSGPATAAEAKTWLFQRLVSTIAGLAWEEYKEQQREGSESADVIKDEITVT